MKFAKSKNLKSRIILITIFIILAFFVLLLIIITPVGNDFIKKIVEVKIEKYIPGAKITYLDYGVDNFSLTAEKGHNTLKIYGVMVPLNAMFEANIRDLSDLDPQYRGKMSVSGKLYEQNGKYVIDGMSFFAGGYMNFLLKMNNSKIIKAHGKGFDIQNILYMLRINNPWISGSSNIIIDKRENSPYIITVNSKGDFNHIINTSFTSKVTVKAGEANKYGFRGIINSSIGNFIFTGKRDSGKWYADFVSKTLNLNKLHKLTLYPFKGIIDIKGSYDSSNGNRVLKFENSVLSGYISSDTEISFNMDSGRFFSYLGIDKIMDATVSGSFKIHDNMGIFDIVCNNVRITNKRFIRRLYMKTGINLAREKLGKVFIKGVFDKNRVVFNLLSTNQNISISIKKGILQYPDKYSLIFYVRKNNNIYKLKVSNNTFRIIEKREFRPQDNEILVF